MAFLLQRREHAIGRQNTQAAVCAVAAVSAFMLLAFFSPHTRPVSLGWGYMYHDSGTPVLPHSLLNKLQAAENSAGVGAEGPGTSNQWGEGAKATRTTELQLRAGPGWSGRTQLVPDYTYKRGGFEGDDSSTTQKQPAGDYYGEYTGGVHTGTMGARAQQ
eukprot:3940773-Rhodomonas_salina.1